MSYSVSVDLDLRGAVFENGPEILEQWTDDVLDSMGKQGLSELGFQMDIYFKDPTPYYETQVRVDAAGHERVLHDTGIIYGPWLDGSGSRNQTTRFKGYPHWRRTKQWLDEIEGPRIIARHELDLTRRLNA